MALRAKKWDSDNDKLHYSDSWADPGKQTKPAAWAKYDFNGLMKAVYDYTYDVMSALKANGITPEWVQVEMKPITACCGKTARQRTA